MDSTLLCLFGIADKTITNQILEKNLELLKNEPILWTKCNNDLDSDIERRKNIQKSLVRISNSMRSKDRVKTCSNLRKMIKSCPGSQNFGGRDTQDAGEFLSYLFGVFQVDVSRTLTTVHGSNKEDDQWTLVTEIKDKKAVPIIDVHSTSLLELGNGSIDLRQFLQTNELSEFDDDNKWRPDRNKPDVVYTKKLQVFSLESSPLVIFNVLRNHMNKRGIVKMLKTDIVPPEEIQVGHRALELRGIVVHTGVAHYMANIKCGNNWFLYDDNPTGKNHTLKLTGSYIKMLKTKPSPTKNGTLYFYVEKYDKNKI